MKKCLKELIKEGNNRKLENIMEYIGTLDPFINLLQEQGDNYEEILKKSCIIMKHILKLKNEFVVQLGDKGDDFYIILNGIVGIFVPILKDYYMTEEEFILHLLKLRKNGQKELIQNCLRQNAFSCSLPYEHFDDLLYDLNNNKTKGGIFIDSELILNKAQEVCKYILTEEYKIKLIKNEPEAFINENDVNEKIKNISEQIKKELKETSKDKNNTRIKKILGNKKIMRIYKYEMVRKLTIGDTFGELALENKNNKRTATIIACDTCHFAIINKEEYNILIKDSVKKYKKKFFNLIYSYKIFKTINIKLFDRDHYNNFRFSRIPKNRIILQDGAKCNEIYFILNGDFELYIEKNIYEINNIINKLKASVNQMKYLLKIKEGNQKIQNLFVLLRRIEKNLKKENLNQELYKEILSKKMKIKLGIYTSKQVIGFINFINYFNNNDDLSLFNCYCTSYYGEVYKIIYPKYLILYQKEKCVQFFTNELTVLNICHILERLLSHKSFELNKIIHEKKYLENKLIKKQLKKHYNKNIVNLENKKIKTKSLRFRCISSFPRSKISNDNSNSKIHKSNYSEIRNNSKYRIKSSKKTKFIQYNENIQIYNQKDYIYDSTASIKDNKITKIPKSAVIRKNIRNVKISNNSYLDYSFVSKNNVNKNKVKSCSNSNSKKTVIKIPNIYKIFFPLFNQITINKDKYLETNNKINNQILKVHKLHEENKNESFNFNKYSKLDIKKRINTFKKTFKKNKYINSKKNILNITKEKDFCLFNYKKSKKNDHSFSIFLNND